MAFVPRRTFAAHPGPERGRGVLIGGHEPSQYISYCAGKNVVLRSLKDPRDCLVYVEHAYPATVARISPNGEWVASADVSGTVRVWGRFGEQKLKYELRAINGAIDDLQWSSDGQRILVCGDGKPTYVRVFTWDSGGNLGEFDGHSKRVLSCAFKPTRPFRIFSGGEDLKVNYYEGPPFRFKASNTDHSKYVNCVRFSPDGSKLVSVSSDRQAFIFDGKTGERIGAFASEDAHTGSIYAVSWSPDGKQVVTASADKTAKIWNVADDGSTATVAATYSFGSDVDNMQMGCLWLGGQVVTISLNGDISVLAPSLSEGPQRTLFGHSKLITAVATHGADVITGSYDGTVLRWSEEGGAEARMGGSAAEAGVLTMAVAGDLLLLGCLDDTVRTVHLPDFSPVPDAPPLKLGAQPADMCVAAAAPELAIVATTENSTVLLRNSKFVSSFSAPFTVTVAALSPDGKEAAVGGEDGFVRVYEVEGDALREVAKLEKHRGAISAIRYSPDGTMLATGDQNREAVIWDTTSREVRMKNMVYHTARISSLAWAPDSSRLATGSLDNTLIVYDVPKAPSERIHLKAAHAGGVSAVAFLSTTTLVSAGHDACLRFWSLPEP